MRDPKQRLLLSKLPQLTAQYLLNDVVPHHHHHDHHHQQQQQQKMEINDDTIVSTDCRMTRRQAELYGLLCFPTHTQEDMVAVILRRRMTTLYRHHHYDKNHNPATPC